MNGKSPGGPRPFGFEADGLTLRESEAGEIRRMTRAVISGSSLGSLVRDLNARGVTTSRGTPWTLTKLRNVLLRPRNAGLLAHEGQEAGAAPWPAVVGELEWRQMRAVLADPARRTAQSNRVSSLGSGLYRCGLCGAVLRISTSGTGSKVRGYRCSAQGHLTQAAAPLDEYVLRRLSLVLSRPGLLKELARLESEAARRESDAVSDAEARIQAAGARLAELGEMFAEGQVDARTLKAATEKLRAQAAEAEKTLAGTGTAAAGKAAVLELLAGPPGDLLRRSPLAAQRTILSFCAVVTVMPATVRGGRFDPGRVRFEWTGHLAQLASAPACACDPADLSGDGEHASGCPRHWDHLATAQDITDARRVLLLWGESAERRLAEGDTFFARHRETTARMARGVTARAVELGLEEP